ncbi:MAG TPA: DUF6624 domain-containing protein [Ktedonobacteraceae bacterium]
MDEILRAELLAMERLDRDTRAELVKRGKLHAGGYHPQMQAVHTRHNARMRAILETYGWPGRSLVGDDGCRAAGFVVQHAILDADLQRRGVELLSAAVAQQEAEPFMLALLTDRVLMQEGHAQIYGTQYVGDAHGGVEPWPIANPETVDQRRLAFGLPPLAENTLRLNAQQRQEMSKMHTPEE